MADTKDPITARQVAGWLQDYARLLEAKATEVEVFARIAGIHGGDGVLREEAATVIGVAARLYDQKGVVRDSGYQDLLLREAMVRLELPRGPQWNTAIFPTTGELIEAIRRHTTP